MDDRHALMTAIVANPDEDTPRLVFADWLQEHGDEQDRARAEPIRLQIEYDPLKVGSAPRNKLQRRAVAIQKKHAKHWLGPLWPIIQKGWGDELDGVGLFRRGLLFWWYVAPKQFLQKSHQKAVREWFPLVGINDLTMHTRATQCAGVAASPALAWAPEFAWDEGKIDDAGLSALAASPHFTRLSTFSVDQNVVTDKGLREFADTATMPNLRTFKLWSGNKAKYTAAGMLALVSSKRFPNLCDLELECGQPNSLKWAELFADPRVKRLKRLMIGWKGDIAAAVRSPNLSGLEELGGNDVTFTEADADALLANPAFAGLKRFHLESLDVKLTPVIKKKLRERFGDGLSLAFA
ncbi:MAG TPA: TIGR02996 domain-containing protein [Gemmataceae bacterium]|nr:TIGR02996 domain-containing protein [Gemmataceae bacterium]